MKKIFSYLVLALISFSLFSSVSANEGITKTSGTENFSLWFDARDYLDESDGCSTHATVSNCPNQSFYDSLNNLFNFAILIVFFILVAKILIKLSWGWEDKGWMGWMGMMGWWEDMFSFKKLMAKIWIDVWALIILFALAFWIVADIKVFVWYVKKTFTAAVQVEEPATNTNDGTLQENVTDSAWGETPPAEDISNMLTQ